MSPPGKHNKGKTMELLRTIAMLCPLGWPNPALKNHNGALLARINQEICVDQFTRCVDAKLNGRTFAGYRIIEQATALKECIKEKNIGRKVDG